MDINIIGTALNDTALYLARVLSALGGRVLIRDYTRDKSLSYCIPAVYSIGPEEDIIDYAGVGYTYSKLAAEQYDTCIRIYDYNRVPDDENSFTIIVADESKMVVKTLSELDWSDMVKAETKVVLIVKRYTGAVRKQFDELIKAAGIKETFPLPMNAHDEKCAILAEHNSSFIFSNISAKYQETLVDIARLIRSDLNLSLKEAEAAFKKAAKGGKK